MQATAHIHTAQLPPHLRHIDEAAEADSKDKLELIGYTSEEIVAVLSRR
ncbi:hypothetical protein OBV_27180 [Oscillibacter valericigenes Sjm18-20]|nr:hypothetical protein OBV_27180 [Oscillibacter valericigenes Sjm18-20]